MRLHSPFAAWLLMCVMVLYSCKGIRQTGTEPVQFKLKASAQPYVAAMGSGRGVIFQIYFETPKLIVLSDLQLDSLLIHSTNVNAEKVVTDNLLRIEANYFKTNPEKQEADPQPLPVTESPDPILYFSEYQPAFLYIHYKGRAYTLPIDTFQRISD